MLFACALTSKMYHIVGSNVLEYFHVGRPVTYLARKIQDATPYLEDEKKQRQVSKLERGRTVELQSSNNFAV